MLVAVIDDGILPEMFSAGPLRYDMHVARFGRVRTRRPKERILTTHGTTVAGIIRKYAPDVELCSVRVFSGGIMKTTCGKLAAAMRWCLKMNIPLINLSLGTVEPKDFRKIRRITERLLRNGQVIVAACNKNGRYTMPAMYPGVLGVQTDAALSENQYRRAEGIDGVDYIASSIHTLTLCTGTDFQTPLSNSYAAPTVTAAVASGRIQAGGCTLRTDSQQLYRQKEKRRL